MFFNRKQKPKIAATPVMGGSMYDFATSERREALRRDAGFLPVVLAAKRDASIDMLGEAYQMHPKYDPAKYPHHPRIGVMRTEEARKQFEQRFGVTI